MCMNVQKNTIYLVKTYELIKDTVIRNGENF